MACKIGESPEAFNEASRMTVDPQNCVIFATAQCDTAVAATAERRFLGQLWTAVILHLTQLCLPVVHIETAVAVPANGQPLCMLLIALFS